MVMAMTAGIVMKKTMTVKMTMTLIPIMNQMMMMIPKP